MPYGFAISKLLHFLVKKKNNIGIIECVFLGITTITSLVCCINFFYPINKIVLIGICIIGLSFYVCYWKEIMNLFKSNVYKFTFNLNFFCLILLAICFIFVLLYSLFPANVYDMNLYHKQYMQWTSEYRIIPGLGNLHGRLAFNSSFLLLTTLFYNFKSVFILFPINEMIALLVLVAVFRNWNKREDSTNVICLLLYFSYIFLFGDSITSSSTDFGCNLLILYLFLYVRDKYQDINIFDIFYVFAISLFCATLKLSCVIILLLPLFLIIKYSKIVFSSKNIFILLIIGIIIIVPWVIRFVILSGYLIYPFDAIDIFNFDWKIPIDNVTREKHTTYWWARNNHMRFDEVMQMDFIQWFPIWFQKLNLSTKIIFSSALLSPITLLILSYFRSRISGFLFVATGIGFVGTLYLITTAPDLRFASSFVLVASLTPWIAIIKLTNWIGKISIIVIYISFFVLSLFSIHILNKKLCFYNIFTDKNVLLLTVRPWEYYTTTNNIKYNSLHVDGRVYYYPLNDDRCFDHELPCTPYPNPNLHFRGDRIEDGFIIKQE